MVAVGLTLQADWDFLALGEALILGQVDLYALAPECLWRAGPGGSLLRNDFFGAFCALKERTRRPFVAHGRALGLGSNHPDDLSLRARWLSAVSREHRAFGFGWYTEGAAISRAAGQGVGHNQPVPWSPESAAVACKRLRQMRAVVPRVAVGNPCHYFCLGDPLDQARWLRAVCERADAGLMLDLQHVWTMGHNLGFDPEAWLALAPLDRVLGISLSGGRRSELGWLPEGRTMWMDNHDGPVHPEVWDLLTALLPRVPTLEAVVLDTAPLTAGHEALERLGADLAQLRQRLEAAHE